MGIQVIGNNGENIIKSPIVEAYIGSSLLDSTEVASDAPTDISTKVEQLMAAKHSHSNKAVLDKFAETNGKPTYNGQALGGGASTAEDVSYTNTQLPNVTNVKTALDEIVPKSHSHKNKDTLDKISVSDGKLQYNGSDVGLKGADGITPTIGANGNWYLGTTDTGKPSRGEKGDTGASGAPGKDGANGSPGADGITPHIGDNGNWYLGATDTGKPSRGVAGAKGSDGANGKDGAQGEKGADGKTPVKGTDYWTAADKAEIVKDTLATLPTWTGGNY
jgi:hypothetical protein